MAAFQDSGIRAAVELDSILGNRYVLGWLAFGISVATYFGLALLLVLLLMRLVLRRGWLAGVAFVSLPTSLLLVAELAGGSDDSPVLLVLSSLIMATLLTGTIVVLTRCGLVAMCALMYCCLLLTTMPITGDMSVRFWEEASLLVLGASQ